jgi:hypothetical protein
MLQFLIADSSGSIKTNLYGEIGSKMKSGDILYMEGMHCSMYKDKTLTLYMSKHSKIYVIGRFFMTFSENPHMSETTWVNQNGTYTRTN